MGQQDRDEIDAVRTLLGGNGSDWPVAVDIAPELVDLVGVTGEWSASAGTDPGAC